MKSRNQKRPKKSDKKSRKSKKMKGGLKVERQPLGICGAVAMARCLYRLCKLVFHSDTDENELYIPNEKDTEMYEEYKTANKTDKSNDKYKRVRTIEKNQKNLFFSFLAVIVHSYKDYTKEKFESKPFQRTTRNFFFLNDDDEFSVIENKNDFKTVYYVPFDKNLARNTNATQDEKASDTGNIKLMDWLQKNAGLIPHDTEAQQNSYNDIITKLKNRGYKLEESVFNPNHKKYNRKQMNYFFQTKNLMLKYVDEKSKQIQTDKIETISTYMIVFQTDKVSLPEYKGRVGVVHATTLNSAQKIDDDNIKIRYVDPNFFDEQENIFLQGVINFTPYYLSPIDKESLPPDWDDIKLKWAKYMLPNFNIEYEDDTITNDDNNEMINNDSDNESIQINTGTIDDNESIKSNTGTIGDNESIKSNTGTIGDNESIQINTGTIDDNESINTSSSYNNENFFDIAIIPPELHQHSEHLNVSRPVDVYSLIGKTFKYIEFNSTHNIVNKVREYKIVADGENSVKFVLS